ncbi:MAG: isoprenylcysteine carboxylmethyltransferase family protein [Desulfobulbaceae bacterium]
MASLFRNNRYHTLIQHGRLPLSMVVGSLLFFLVAGSRSHWESQPFIETSLFVSGCLLVGIASLGRLWCSLYIAGYKSDRIVTVGPYSLCRNPLYFFSFIGLIGCGLATETLTIPLLVVLFFAVYYPLVIHDEECELRLLHGEVLDAYLASTPAFFPKFSLFSEPREYVVHPRIFRKHLFDNLWFIWIVGILELVEGVKEIVAFPGFFELY